MDACLLVNLFHQWCALNGMAMNEVKTKFIVVSNKIDITIDIIVNETRIEESKVLKYPGVWLDSDLSFGTHIDNCTSKISKGIFVLRYFKKFCQLNILMLIIIH